jgi:hypothetical protein
MTAHMGFCPSRGIRALPCVLRISGDPSTKSVCDQCDDDQHLLVWGSVKWTQNIAFLPTQRGPSTKSVVIHAVNDGRIHCVGALSTEKTRIERCSALLVPCSW